MQHHHLLYDRRWLYWESGPWAPTGTLAFKAHQPRKLNQALLVADKPWESMAVNGHTIMLDQGRYRCWYEAYDDTYQDDVEARLCYAESDDGLTWRKPNLGRVEWRGSRQNNILIDGAQAFYGFGFCGECVFIDPTAAPSERYKMIYLGSGKPWFGGAYHSVMMQAYSADGIDWRCRPRPAGPGPATLLAYRSDTQTVVFWDPAIRKYVGYFRSLEPGYWRCIARAETSDFYNWPKPETVLRPDLHDPPGVDLYNNAASRYESGDDAGYFFFISVFDHASDTLNVQLASSRNGIQWSREDRTPVIRNGPERFDQGGVYAAPSVIPFQGGLAVSYHGVSYKHSEATPDQIRYQGALSFAVLPKDRFLGLHATSECEFCLQGFALESERLGVTANADVEPGGEVRAALVSGNSVVPGMEFAACRPITSDQTAGRPDWTPGADLRPFVGKPVMLRLRMTRATIYAVSLQ